MAVLSWSDDPIRSRGQDTLGRADYARGAAELIVQSHTWESSIVFGLTGPWGSGKTSIVEMIEESLASLHPDWAIARFVPWAASDAPALLGQFYASLIASLPKSQRLRVRKAFGKLAQISAPVAQAIPYAGQSVAEVLRATGDRLTMAPAWDEAFEDASRRLRYVSTPVLIVADDIDRLQFEELATLLKVVRLLGRFPGVQYLLAYDDSTISQTLNVRSADPDYGRRFMEKIVQYPLVTPPLSEYQLFERIESGLDSILREHDREALESGRLSGASEVFRSRLRTPRAVDRYLAQVRHNLPLIASGEVDDADYILVILLQTSFPAVFNELPRWRSALIRGHTEELNSGSKDMTFEPFNVGDLLAAVPAGDAIDAKVLLALLFPKIAGKKEVVFQYERPKGIATDAYFDRYLSMGIPTYDVSDAQVVQAVEEVRQGQNTSLLGLLAGKDDKLGARILGKARGVSLDDWSTAEMMHLIEALCEGVDRLATDGGLFGSSRDLCVLWIAQLVGTLDNPDGIGLSRVLGYASWGARLECVDRSKGRLAEPDNPPAWWIGVVARLADQAADAFIAHLKARDDADNSPGRYLADFSTRHEAKVGLLRERLSEVISAEGAGLADLAARMVTTHTILGSNRGLRLGDVDTETWARVVPLQSDDWFVLPRLAYVDESDVSWSNRKRFAQGRLGYPA